MTELKFDLNELYSSTHPTYIVTMDGEILLFANPAAFAANQNALDRFLGKSFAAFSYPEELESRKAMLRSQGKLTNYEYNGLNYYKDEDEWQRKEVKIIGEQSLIEFFGLECHLSIDLKIEEIRRFENLEV